MKRPTYRGRGAFRRSDDFRSDMLARSVDEREAKRAAKQAARDQENPERSNAADSDSLEVSSRSHNVGGNSK